MILENNGESIKYEGTTYTVGANVIATIQDPLHAGCMGTIEKILTDEDNAPDEGGISIVCSFKFPADTESIKELERRWFQIVGDSNIMDGFTSLTNVKPAMVQVLEIKKINLHPVIVQTLKTRGWEIEETMLPCYGGIYHTSFCYPYTGDNFRGKAVFDINFDGSIRSFVASAKDALSKYDPKEQERAFVEKAIQYGEDMVSAREISKISFVLAYQIAKLMDALQEVVGCLDYLEEEASLEELEDLLDYQITGDMVEDGLETRIEESLAEFSYARFDNLLLRIRAIQSLKNKNCL